MFVACVYKHVLCIIIVVFNSYVYFCSAWQEVKFQQLTISLLEWYRAPCYYHPLCVRSAYSSAVITTESFSKKALIIIITWIKEGHEYLLCSKFCNQFQTNLNVFSTIMPVCLVFALLECWSSRRSIDIIESWRTNAEGIVVNMCFLRWAVTSSRRSTPMMPTHMSSFSSWEAGSLHMTVMSISTGTIFMDYKY